MYSLCLTGGFSFDSTLGGCTLCRAPFGLSFIFYFLSLSLSIFSLCYCSSGANLRVSLFAHAMPQKPRGRVFVLFCFVSCASTENSHPAISVAVPPTCTVSQLELPLKTEAPREIKGSRGGFVCAVLISTLKPSPDEEAAIIGILTVG